MTFPRPCDLCGLPVRLGGAATFPNGSIRHFCCPGCRRVFQMILESLEDDAPPDPARFRETDIFRTCQELGIIPRDETDLNVRFADAPSSDNGDGSSAISGDSGQRPHPPVPSPGGGDLAGHFGATTATVTQRPACVPPSLPGKGARGLGLTFIVEGMWCPACAWVIDEGLKRLPGVDSAETSFATDRLRCRIDPARISEARVVERIRRMGYEARVRENPAGDASDRREFIRLCVSGLCAMNVMMLSFALYHGFFTEFTTADTRYLSWPIALLACVPFLYGGAVIHRRALSGSSMETLISAASASAFGYSVMELLRGGIHLYFDTASMLITLTLLGKYLETRARRRVRADIDAVFGLRPAKVRIVTDLQPRGRLAAIGQLTPGDRFRVLAGETVPADGRLLTGRGLADESSLTGEARPLVVKPGDRLHAGARLTEGEAILAAEAVGDDTLLGQMIRIMEGGLTARSDGDRITERLLRWFTPLILTTAGLTFAVLLLYGTPLETALTRAITVMVIACPCALGIAIPLARVAGIAIAGRHGLLVKNPAAFETAGRVDAMVFDKTGTLTEGRFRLLSTDIAGEWDDTTVLSVAAGLETDADHPVASALRQAAAVRGLIPDDVTDTHSLDAGRAGRWNGLPVCIGPHREERADAAAGPETLIRLDIGGQPAAIFAFGDRMRPGAAKTVADLARRGIRILLVSGDGPGATAAAAEVAGIPDWRAAQLPDAKASLLRELAADGHVPAMIGDGVNDAPALTSAPLSFAVHSGSALGQSAADVILLRSDLRQIPVFLDLAARVRVTVRRNFVWACLYNLGAIPVAVAGGLNPLVAVTAMLLSSLTVIGATLRLFSFRPGERG